MIELILEMAGCLLAALALGFLLGWFIKRAFAREQYEPRIEELELNCAQDKNLIQEQQKVSALIKEQFLSTQDDLEKNSLQLTQAQEHIIGYQSEITTLKTDIDEKNIHLQNAENTNKLLNTSLSDIESQLTIKTTEITNQLAELDRVKEHHLLLKKQVDTLSQEKHIKNEEIDKLTHMIGGYKEDYAKLIDEQSQQKDQLTSLKTTLNERNLATVALEEKMREVNAQNHKITLEANASRTALAQKEALLNDFKHTAKQTAKVEPRPIELSPNTNIMIANQDTQPSKFMKLLKKTLGSITETREDINKKADKVIQEYKNKNS